MPIPDLDWLLVLVEPDGPRAQSAFRFSHNEERCHFGKAEDALAIPKEAASPKANLTSHIVHTDKAAAIYLALGLNESPRDISKGFIFGSDPETCDILLAENIYSGISGNHFSIGVDWHTGNPLITCLTPNDGSPGIRIKSGSNFSLFLQDEWKVLDPGETAIIMISDSMKMLVHSPGVDARESVYRSNLGDYFHEYQAAVPEMAHLELFDSDPTPLLVHRGRGLTGLEYVTTTRSVSEKVVSCEAKTRQNWTEPYEIYIVKRFRYVTDRWPRRAKTELSRLCKLQHVGFFASQVLLTSHFNINLGQENIVVPEDIITSHFKQGNIIVPEDITMDMTEYMPVYLPELPESLADRQHSAPLTVIDAVEVLAQIFEGLKFLHAHDIVHGSVYPAVVKIKRSCPWSIKLSDIGLYPYVGLEDQEERALYLSQPRRGTDMPVPVSDTWSAGVVGLALILPGGLPARSMGQTSTQSSWVRALAKRARDFRETERLSLSGVKEAALFLPRVLEYLHSKRLTAEECLQDPWISRRQHSIPYEREYSADPNDQLLGAFNNRELEVSSVPDDEEEDEGAQHERAQGEEVEEEEAEDEIMASEEAAYEEAVKKELAYLEERDEGPEYVARKPRTRKPKKGKQPRKA